MEVTSWLIERCMDVHFIPVLLTTLLILLWLRDLRHAQSMPPGPFQWSLLGCIPQLVLHSSGADPLGYLLELSKEYNGMFTMKLGSFQAVFISDLELLKEALVRQGDCFSNRPQNMEFPNIIQGRDKNVGVTYIDGERWRVIKKFVVSSMRDLGVGKKNLEDKIHEELQAITSFMATLEDKPCDLTSPIHMAVANTICSIIFAKRKLDCINIDAVGLSWGESKKGHAMYEYQDEDFQDILVHSKTLNSSVGWLDARSLFLPLRILPEPKKYRVVEESRRGVMRVVKKQLDLHRKTYNPSIVLDFIDLYLQKQLDHKAEDNHYFDNAMAEQMLFELFVGGMETSATTLCWALLYLVKYPDVQKKCQQEIDRVIGTRQIWFSDRTNLPYVEATLAEVQRVTNIIPLSATHSTDHDTTLQGYKIPKGTWVFPILFATSVDEKAWREPDKFTPERFLDEKGKVQRPEHLLPFSIGPRMCAGDSLARMELFLFLATFLQKFTFFRSDKAQMVDLTPVIGVTQSPKPQKISLTVR